MPVLLAVLAFLAAAEVAVNVLFRPQEGPLALAAVLEPYMLATGAVAGLLAILATLGWGRAGAPIRLVGAVVLVVAIVRLGGEWWSPGVSGAGAGGAGENPGAVTLTVMSWNLELGSKAAADSVAGIADADADLVALQELTPDVSAAIEADPALRRRYPYRILQPREGVDGLGLLSRLPLVVGSYSTGPLVLRAGLLLPDGRTVEVLDVHPYPPRISSLAGFPSGLDVRRRDEELAMIADVVAGLPDPGAALVVGDLNTTPFEAGYTALAGPLRDAHAEAGSGTGFTWRPSSLEGLQVGFLRLDHVLTGSWLQPVSAREDCSIAGDHCRLLVTLEIGGG